MALQRKRKIEAKPPVDSATVAQCVAKAVAEGDLVNLRFLFIDYSPLRDGSSENIAWDKYAYLRPTGEQESGPHYQRALEIVQRPEVREQVRKQLEKPPPPQLHADLVLELADNAVRLGKNTVASQAYELLRIREGMQAEFFKGADLALDEQDYTRAARALVIATSLDYDYAAFPEPAPAVPNFQTRALVLHAVYPRRPEDSVSLQPPERHLETALKYLLLDDDAAPRLAERSQEEKLALAEALVKFRDPNWEAFVQRYRETVDLVREYGEALKQSAEEGEPASLQDEIEQQQEERDPRRIPAHLLGREIEDGQWWQYLKELAYEHPPAVLFVTRQMVARDVEIIMPRYLKDSPLVTRLGLAG